MHITVVGCHWGSVILTSTRIGSPRTGEIPLLSLWLGHWGPVILSSTRIGSPDRGDFPTLTMWLGHWGPVILTSTRIGSPDRGDFPTLTVVGPLRPSDSDFDQDWKPRPERFPYSHCGWAIEAQWFWLRPGLEAQTGEISLLSLWLGHWGPVILSSTRIGSPERRDFPTHFQWSQVVFLVHDSQAIHTPLCLR
jgi:hypothetical protein